MTATQISIRQLTYSDLPQVIAIERRSFPTPWSLAMFVLELSKPSGVCLAAVDGGVILGYLICSKYDRVYHLMNIAVDPSVRRHGLGHRLLESLIERAADNCYTLEVRTSNAPAYRAVRQSGSARRAPGHATTRTPVRTR